MNQSPISPARLTKTILFRLGSLSTVADEQIPSLCRVDCAECGQTHSSIVLLGLHYQESHGSSLPEMVLKRFCEKLVAHANDSASTSNGHESPGGSRDRTSRDSSEPPEKRPRSGPTPPGRLRLNGCEYLGHFHLPEGYCNCLTVAVSGNF